MPSKSPVRIWVGTRKGAFLFSSRDRKKWDTAGPFFAGEEVHHVAQDTHNAGDSWHVLAAHLPPSYSVSAALR
jgi:ligand-binding sensor domain-containing protein